MLQKSKIAAGIAALGLSVFAVIGVHGGIAESQSPASHQIVTWQDASGQHVGRVWDSDGPTDRLLVDAEAPGPAQSILRSQLVTTTTPTTPTDTTPTTPTTPTDPTPGPRPFSDDSPFNTPITSPQNLGSATSLLANSGGVPSPLSTDRDESVNYDHPCYYTKSTDPIATLVMSSTRQTFKVPVPDYATIAGQGYKKDLDHHICFVAPDGWEYNLWQTTKSGGPGAYTFTAQIGGRLPANGQGIKTPQLVQQYGSQIDGGVEAKFSERAGLITAADMKAGVIDHALFVVVRAASGTYTYPAYNGAGRGSDPQMGTRLRLDMTAAQVDATSAPSWEKIIAKAAIKYGIYIGDKGGSGFSFMLESSTPYNAAGVTNPWKSYFDSVGIRDSGTYGYSMSLRTQGIWSHLVYAGQPTP